MSLTVLIKMKDSMQTNTSTRYIFQLLHYLLFSLSDVPSLAARHLVVSVLCFIELREESSLGSLQHATGTLIFLFFEKKKILLIKVFKIYRRFKPQGNEIKIIYTKKGDIRYSVGNKLKIHRIVKFWKTTAWCYPAENVVF